MQISQYAMIHRQTVPYAPYLCPCLYQIVWPYTFPTVVIKMTVSILVYQVTM